MVVGVEQTTIYISENRDKVHPESPVHLKFLPLLLMCPGPLTDFLDTAGGAQHRRTQDSGWDWGILL